MAQRNEILDVQCAWRAKGLIARGREERTYPIRATVPVAVPSVPRTGVVSVFAGTETIGRFVVADGLALRPVWEGATVEVFSAVQRENAASRTSPERRSYSRPGGVLVLPPRRPEEMLETTWTDRDERISETEAYARCDFRVVDGVVHRIARDFAFACRIVAGRPEIVGSWIRPDTVEHPREFADKHVRNRLAWSDVHMLSAGEVAGLEDRFGVPAVSGRDRAPIRVEAEGDMPCWGADCGLHDEARFAISTIRDEDLLRRGPAGRAFREAHLRACGIRAGEDAVPGELLEILREAAGEGAYVADRGRTLADALGRVADERIMLGRRVDKDRRHDVLLSLS